MISTSPKSSFTKLVSSKPRPLRVMIIGHDGVGKTAMIVRFITKRFIGDYDPNAQKIYNFRCHIDDEDIVYEIMDGSGLSEEHEHLHEADIRRADAFIIMYAINDKCSFEDTSRLKFLITYAKRRKKLGRERTMKDFLLDAPVLLVGNKNDQQCDRMVSVEEGEKKKTDIFCESFHEISVRESYEDVRKVFVDLFRCWRVFTKCPKLKRSSSDVQNGGLISPDYGRLLFNCSFRSEKQSSQFDLKKSYENVRPDDNQETKTVKESDTEPFRSRACTEGAIMARPKKWQCPSVTLFLVYPMRSVRRMSISLRGSNSSDWASGENNGEKLLN